MISNLASCNPLQLLDFAFEVCQAEVKTALASLAESEEVRSQLEVVVGPAKHKGVFAKQCFKPGSLELAPSPTL